ncbi:arginine--tRNA ligase [Aquirufa antheringensis]|jgi:arginyl-tRNA synthetase|uniref:Arginine--tRNA ligase n=1 Tax=Aquirufa antheringensis TaxID=2516559 RepID=A0A4Q9B871_9BACT|nr:arginine--tRNA ligase [Aquirufa antheringensis]MCZ2485759.1 arginine--tRNA ligase [Aquirufa antheringensis]MCZ2486548.1 arginine--tRNA ligase [Aquirufa antheringensis]MCZ2488671.1 arginine--tRNA ligase [Aquirufa antheringensis]TBH71107.1 arginine--tRNA ligase [Aquirufa antheringensis]
MSNIQQTLQLELAKGLKALFQIEVTEIALQETKKEFEGAYTLVVFPFTKQAGKSPASIATDLGEYMLANCYIVRAYQVVQGFLNLSIQDSAWLGLLASVASDKNPFQIESKGEKVLIEYSSPNTNKPLHLGHLRNNFLGFSVAQILAAGGYDVVKTNLVNDRGIHICKSMLAYQLFGNHETPETSGLKGDHLVGKYYVAFDVAYKEEIAALKAGGLDEEQAKKQAPILLKAQEMLLKWEQGDEEVMNLWNTMNAWVFAGFEKSYQTMGVSFDKIYRESNTYLLGKQLVDEGLAAGVFFQKPDGSVWINLEAEGLDEKLVLRKDGTSVYITQDMGTAQLKYEDFKANQSVYVVGNEQDYHFEVLFHILKKLNKPFSQGNFHLSYGMVDLPSGKMKSREGTVVDADDLMAEMIQTAKDRTLELGKIDGFTEAESNELFHNLGLGALKYFLLKVEPKKRMLFNPEESIDFQGNTGPFIQYTHARICSILRKGGEITAVSTDSELAESEQELIYLLGEYKASIAQAAANFAPSVIANYAYDLAKTFNKFYNELSILSEENEVKRNIRLTLAELTGKTIQHATLLLGIVSPNRM